MPQETNKLVAIRLKEDENQYGPQIPVSAKAENVIYNNKYNIKDVLGQVNTEKGSLQAQIDALETDTISETVLQWMDDNISQGTTIVLDKKLTEPNMAAEAQAAGNLITIGDNEIDPNSCTKVNFNPTQETCSVALMEDIQNLIAETYSSNLSYDIGQYVLYNGFLYRCIKSTSGGNFSSSHWEQIKIAPQITDTKISSEKINSTILKSENLFNSNTIIPNYFITDAGNLLYHLGSHCSDFIPVEGGASYTFSYALNLKIIEYKSDKTTINRVYSPGQTNAAVVYQVQSDTAFIRISLYGSVFPAQFMCIKGESLPDSYIGYYTLNSSVYTNYKDIFITKTGNNRFRIGTGKGEHILEKQTNNDKTLETWRITAGYGNGNRLFYDIDVEGPIWVADNNYIGGYHGYEKIIKNNNNNIDDIKFIINGREQELNNLAVGEILKCNSLDVFIKSNLLNRSDGTTPIFSRNKHLCFKENKVIISNVYNCLQNNTKIKRAIIGLYGIDKNICNGFSTNESCDLNNASTSLATNIKNVTFYSNGFTVTVKPLNFSTNLITEPIYRSSVEWNNSNSGLVKAYFFQFSYTDIDDNDDVLSMESGNKLFTEYEIEFN